MTTPSYATKTKPVRLAIVGCGWHSETAHAQPLAHYVSQNLGEVALVAACDSDMSRANRFCERYGFARAYTQLEAMLQAETLDGIVSVLPVSKTAEVGGSLLRTGIPCLLEKPLGSSLEEALRLAEIARSTGTPNMVSLNRRFNPYLNLAIEWAKDIGALIYIRAQMLRNARREPEFIWGTGLHVVDAMRHIGGAIASMEVQRLPAHSGASSRLLALQYESSARGHIEILPDVGMNEEGFDLFGEGFRASVVTIGGGGESVRCWRGGKLEIEKTADPDAPLFLRDGSYEETSAFIRSLREGGALFPTIEDALPSHVLCHEAQGAIR